MLAHVCLDVPHLARRGRATTGAPDRRRLTPCMVLVLVVAFLALRPPLAFAEDVVAEPHAAPAETPEQDLGALLLKIEQQIVDRHMVSPASDNAMETWQRVTESMTTSPGSLRELEDFAAHLRTRAASEQAAGQPSLSLDFAVLADLATGLLKRNDVTLAALPDNPPAQAEQPITVQPGPVLPLPAAESPAADRADASPPLPPVPTEKAPVVVALAPAASPVPRAPTAQDLAVAAQFASRGDQMMALKDVSAARRFYEFAANAGNAHAAAALAKTFDPGFFRQAGVIGLRPDPALAATWYRKAAALGDREAGARLQAMGVAAPQ